MGTFITEQIFKIGRLKRNFKRTIKRKTDKQKLVLYFHTVKKNVKLEG